MLRVESGEFFVEPNSGFANQYIEDVQAMTQVAANIIVERAATSVSSIIGLASHSP